MAYTRICKTKYYLIWDVDTITITHTQMFEKSHPFFDMKYEYHVPYFNIINRLIQGLKYSISSYISEHMIIKTEFMKDLLYNIEINSNIQGKLFWEKIILSTDIENNEFKCSLKKILYNDNAHINMQENEIENLILDLYDIETNNNDELVNDNIVLDNNIQNYIKNLNINNNINIDNNDNNIQ